MNGSAKKYSRIDYYQSGHVPIPLGEQPVVMQAITLLPLPSPDPSNPSHPMDPSGPFGPTDLPGSAGLPDHPEPSNLSDPSSSSNPPAQQPTEDAPASPDDNQEASVDE